MEKYKCESGMKTVISEMTNILFNKEIGTNNDRALLYNYRAAYENIFTENITKAISLENKALSLCIPEANPVLAANLNMNLGNLYFQKNELDRAKKYMETAINLMSNANTPTADLIIMTRNYANLLYMRGEKMQALNALMKCSEFAENVNHTEYAALLYDAAVMNIDLKNINEAVRLFNLSFKAYSQIGAIEELQIRQLKAAALLSKVGFDFPNNMALS